MATRRPKPGDRFLARHLVNEQVVTATRRFGHGIAVYFTSAALWEAGDRKGRWTFDLEREAEIVAEWKA